MDITPSSFSCLNTTTVLSDKNQSSGQSAWDTDSNGSTQVGEIDGRGEGMHHG